MRIVIEQGIEGYQEVILEVASWFCEKEGIIRNTAQVIKQTSLAILIRTGDKEVWIPKSLIETHPIPQGLGDWQT